MQRLSINDMLLMLSVWAFAWWPWTILLILLNIANISYVLNELKSELSIVHKDLSIKYI